MARKTKILSDLAVSYVNDIKLLKAQSSGELLWHCNYKVAQTHLLVKYYLCAGSKFYFLINLPNADELGKINQQNKYK